LSRLTGIVLLAVACGCGSSRNNEGMESYLAFARLKYSTDFMTELNENGSFALCMHKPKSSSTSARSKVHFFVYDLARQMVMVDDSLDNGTVGWLNDTQLDIDLLPEMIDGSETPERLGYIYDLYSQRKLSK
jgi:hypothetical protein